MHDAYSKSSNDDVKTAKFAVADEVDDANNLGSSNEDINNSIDGSRLYERLGNFDARTHHMNSDSYMQFADVRRGSFLPRKGLDQESKKWAKSKSVKKKGNTAGQKHTTWTNLHPSSVIFLHWLGFDPLSSLPPPDEDTTQALGFLAHDFLGKIVEKVRHDGNVFCTCIVTISRVFHRQWPFIWRSLKPSQLSKRECYRNFRKAISLVFKI